MNDESEGPELTLCYNTSRMTGHLAVLTSTDQDRYICFSVLIVISRTCLAYVGLQVLQVVGLAGSIAEGRPYHSLQVLERRL